MAQVGLLRQREREREREYRVSCNYFRTASVSAAVLSARQHAVCPSCTNNVTSVSICLPQPKRRQVARAVELAKCIRQNGDTRPRRVHCRILEISGCHDGSFCDLLQSVRAKCSIMPQIKAQVVPSTVCRTNHSLVKLPFYLT